MMMKPNYRSDIAFSVFDIVYSFDDIDYITDDIGFITEAIVFRVAYNVPAIPGRNRICVVCAGASHRHPGRAPAFVPSLTPYPRSFACHHYFSFLPGVLRPAGVCKTGFSAT
jgi:hypothetical protein